MKYPAGFEIEKDNQTIRFVSAGSAELKNIVLNIEIKDLGNNSLSDAYKISYFYDKDRLVTATIIELNGLPALKVAYQTEDVNNITYEIFLIKNKKLFGLFSRYSYFDQILSTFKFIK